MSTNQSYDVNVLGGGRMASAYTEALKSGGLTVNNNPDNLNAPYTIAAFFSGMQSKLFLEGAALQPGAILIDLTTQTVDTASHCGALAKSSGILYAAGGITGGSQQVGSVSSTLLLGGSATQALPSWLSMLGNAMIFDSIEQAVSAKLLHNFVLLMINHCLSIALELAQLQGIGNFTEVLERGTAGRSLRRTSAVRDFEDYPISSYSAQLVSKDLKAMLDSFPQLAGIVGIDLKELSSYYKIWGSEPYTIAARHISYQAEWIYSLNS
jgi:3-hydroxyisobutyrate dehydrogenase-like beta-hydroxyacid dehydrogenase